MPAITRAVFAFAIAVFTLAAVLHPSPARAGMIGTEGVAPASQERQRVKDLIARPEVAKKLEALGVMPQDAASRVDALTDDEVHALATRIDSLPAGGMSDTNWLLVIIAVLVLIIAL